MAVQVSRVPLVREVVKSAMDFACRLVEDVEGPVRLDRHPDRVVLRGARTRCQRFEGDTDRVPVLVRVGVEIPLRVLHFEGPVPQRGNVLRVDQHVDAGAVDGHVSAPGMVEAGTRLFTAQLMAGNGVAVLVLEEYPVEVFGRNIDVCFHDLVPGERGWIEHGQEHVGVVEGRGVDGLCHCLLGPDGDPVGDDPGLQEAVLHVGDHVGRSDAVERVMRLGKEQVLECAGHVGVRILVAEHPSARGKRLGPTEQGVLGPGAGPLEFRVDRTDVRVNGAHRAIPHLSANRVEVTIRKAVTGRGDVPGEGVVNDLEFIAKFLRCNLQDPRYARVGLREVRAVEEKKVFGYEGAFDAVDGSPEPFPDLPGIETGFGVQDVVERGIVRGVAAVKHFAERSPLVAPILVPGILAVHDRDVTGEEEVPAGVGSKSRGRCAAPIAGFPGELGIPGPARVHVLVEDDDVDAEPAIDLGELGDLAEGKHVVPDFHGPAEFTRLAESRHEVADEAFPMDAGGVGQGIPRADSEATLRGQFAESRFFLGPDIEVVVQQNELTVQHEVPVPRVVAHDREQVVHEVHQPHACRFEIEPELAVPVRVGHHVDGALLFAHGLLHCSGEGRTIALPVSRCKSVP